MIELLNFGIFLQGKKLKHFAIMIVELILLNSIQMELVSRVVVKINQ